MIQQSIVAIIVGYAAFSVVRRYAPKAVRQFIRKFAVQLARKLSLNTLAKKIEAPSSASSASCGTGCGPCKGCGSSDTAAPSAANTIKPEALKRTIYQIVPPTSGTAS